MIPECGNCSMYWKGECWGYNRLAVEIEWVCDSWKAGISYLGPVTKAETTRTQQGTVVHLAPALQQRARLLSSHLEREIAAALADLGEQAASAYQTHAVKAKRPGVSMLHRLVARVLASLNIQLWIQQRLLPILRNHTGRVVYDTQRTIATAINLEVQIADEDTVQIAQNAGIHLTARDIEPQVRDSIMAAIYDGLKTGENPTKTAQRIRHMVPKGRFVNAGSAWRSQLIARDQTANAQRAATLAAYRSNPHITAVRLRDGIYGPPRSDSTCIARDGDTVPIEMAGGVHPEHPLCTLGFEPIVSGVAEVPATPEPIAA